MKIIKKFSDVKKIFSKYWNIYGRTAELLLSPYFLAAIIISGLSFNIWYQPEWWNLVLGVIPNIMGFSLGGFAIFLAFGDSKFLELISGSSTEAKYSPFLSVSAAFVHFILVQFLSLLTAIAAKSLYFPLPRWLFCTLTSLSIPEYLIWDTLDIFRISFWFIGFFLFIYALFSAIAATMQIFRLTTWFDTYSNKRKNSQNRTNNNRSQE